MMPFSNIQRYWLYTLSTDMRKSFDGLSRLVSVEMGQDLLGGDVFIFINRRRDCIKLLVWDRTGFVIWYKRLESGTFEVPQAVPGSKEVEIRWEELVMVLEGIRLKSVKRRKRYALSV